MPSNQSPIPISLPLLLSFAITLQISADEWPQFRGPTGDGISTAVNVPVEFGEDQRLAWKTVIPGRGWSSPVFDGEYLWLSTAEEIFPGEEERLQLLREAGEEEKKFKQKQVARSIELAIIQVDYETGEIVNKIQLEEIVKPDPIHNLNSYSSPTPFLTGDKLIAHFGTFGTYCLSTITCEIEWHRRIELEHSVGPGSSPFVHNNLLILICDGVDKQFVTALNVKDGTTAWTVDRPEMRAATGDQKKSYNTPIILTGPNGREQLICMGSQWLVSYEPATGKEFWRLDHGSGFSVVPRPVYSDEHEILFISTGFGKPELLAIRPDGEGDVTDKNKIIWRDPKRIPSRPSPLILGNELYIISEGGIATCFDIATGNVHWSTRIDGNYSASPLFAEGKIYVSSQEGRVTVFEPGTEYKELSANEIDGSIMASPLALDGSLVFRSDAALYRFSQ